MSIELPWSRIARFGIRPILFSGNQEGALGGPTLPIPRPGDRFAVDVGTSRFKQDAESRMFIGALIQATTQDARMPLRQPNIERKAGAGASVVDGAGQAGTTLKLRGLVPRTSVRSGQFFSIVHAGSHYVHMFTAQAIADAQGKLSAPIWPMLRFLTLDAEQVAIDNPMIEGQLVGFDARGASFTRNRTEPLEFGIVERA